MTIRGTIVEVIDGRRNTLILKAALSVLSYFYRVGVALRHFAYNIRLLRAKKVSACVISVGNIIAGGTGKTPFTRLLAQHCLPFAKIGILSRGYLSAAERSCENIKVNLNSDPMAVGDEPLWLARALPTVSVWVGKSRFKSAYRAIDEGCNLLLLDDGLQHRKLYRDKEIILVDGENPFGDHQFLPRGALRDFPMRLKKADLIVLHPYRKEAAVEVRKKTKAPIIGVEWKFDAAIPNRVGLFCGIGKPDRFISMVSQETDVVALLRLLDHSSPDLEELRHFAQEVKEKGGEALVCTEKDAIKLSKDCMLVLPVIPIPATLHVVEGKREWEKFTDEIKKLYE
jgi:tetraacyldisaccharide 4'-kinase